MHIFPHSHFIEPGCVLPADFDPDITLSLTKDRYDVSDFIIMYCPPPPYTTVGGIFSQCTETGWLPDISDKACYGKRYLHMLIQSWCRGTTWHHISLLSHKMLWSTS